MSHIEDFDKSELNGMCPSCYQERDLPSEFHDKTCALNDLLVLEDTLYFYENTNRFLRQTIYETGELAKYIERQNHEQNP
jgi:hypothetical protein